MNRLLLFVLITLLSGCSKQKPVLVAYISTLSGKNSQLGTSGRAGIRMAVEHWNREGGINGRPIELLIFDDKGSVDTGYTIVDSLVNRGVSFVIGPLISKMYPVVKRGMDAGMFFLSPTISTSKLSNEDDLFVRVIAPASYQSKLISQKMREMDLKNILVLLDKGNAEYTEDIYESLVSYESETDCGQKITQRYLQLSKENRPSELVALMDSLKPDGIFIGASAIDFGITSQYLRKSEVEFTLFGSSWSTTGDLIEHGGKAVEGAILIGNLPESNISEKELLFNKLYQKMVGEKVSFIALFANDAAMILFKGISQTESGLPRDVRDYIVETSTFATLQGDIKIDSLGDGYRDNLMIPLRVEDGQLVQCPRNP
jgi:branched-chain amino acid transport system substrate-binding protein